MTRPAYVVTNPDATENVNIEIRLQGCLTKKSSRNITPELLTLKCGHDTPGDDHCCKKQLWTNLLEKEAARELCSDIWPRFLLRLLYFVTF